ncbi:hypothetical protein V6N13_074912 [Hibiscus sabdariffa]
MTLSLPATSSTATYPMGTLKCFESMNFTTLSDSMIQPESGGVVGEEARHHLWSLQGDEDPLRSHGSAMGGPLTESPPRLSTLSSRHSKGQYIKHA